MATKLDLVPHAADDVEIAMAIPITRVVCEINCVS